MSMRGRRARSSETATTTCFALALTTFLAYLGRERYSANASHLFAGRRASSGWVQSLGSERLDHTEQLEEAIHEGARIASDMRTWTAHAEQELSRPLSAAFNSVVPWPLPHNGVYEYTDTFNASSAHGGVVAILRLDPQHNAIVTVSTSGVSLGICPTCYMGVVATVYRDSWEWVVGSGDVISEEHQLLEDDVLLEGGHSYYIVLRAETGVEGFMQPNRGQKALRRDSWDALMSNTDSDGAVKTFQLLLQYRGPLRDWAQPVGSIPFVSTLQSRASWSSLSMGACQESSPMPVRSSGKDVWLSLLSVEDLEVEVTIQQRESSILHVLEEEPHGRGLRSLTCLHGQEAGTGTLSVRLRHNTTYYLVLDVASSTDFGLQSVVITAESGYMFELYQGQELWPAGLMPAPDHIEICGLPFTGPPVSNAGSENLLEPQGCGHSHGGREVWYRYHAAQTVAVTLEATASGDAGGAAYALILYVMEHHPAGDLRQVSCGTDVKGKMASRIDSLTLAAGTTYYFVVDGYLQHSSGVHTLSVNPAAHHTSGLRSVCERPASQTPVAVLTGSTLNHGSGCFGLCGGQRRGELLQPASHPSRGVQDQEAPHLWMLSSSNDTVVNFMQPAL